MKIPVLAAFLLLAGGPVAAQNQAIEGVVLRAGTNQPIAGAEVRVRFDWSAAEISASARTGARAPGPSVSDDRGRFSIAISEPGQYRLSAKAPGYGEQFFGSKTGFLFDKSTKGLVFELKPAGSIRGRVIGVDGVSLAGIEVALLYEAYDEMGRKLFRQAASAPTDDRGVYRFADIGAGQYYVRAHSRSEPVSRSVANIRGIDVFEASRVVPPTFFPSTPSLATASLIEVLAGIEKTGIDIICPRAQTVSFRGTIVDPVTRVAPKQATMSMVSKDALTQTPVSRSVYKGDGTFEFTNVTPGRYWVSAMLSSSLVGTEISPARLVYQSVEISGTDLENVQFAIPSLLSVDARLILEGGAIADLMGYKDIRTYLNSPVTGNGSTLGLSAPPHSAVTPDGEFRFKDVVPDEYRVLVRGLSDDVYVKAVRYANADVLNRPFKLSAESSGRLEVVLSPAGGRISGSLIDGNSQPLPFAEVVLLPAGASEAQHFRKRVTTDADGSFSIRGVPPGNYRVFGWSDEATFGYFEPEVLSAIELSVPNVSVSASSSVTIRATVFRKNAP